MPLAEVHTQVALKEILFATDFSPVAELALPYALGLARAHGAKLYLAHVFPPERWAPVPAEGPPLDREQHRYLAEQQMAAFLEQHPMDDIRHERFIQPGEPEMVIAELIDRLGVDLAVLGTHGRHGLGKVLFGSVAEAISRLASCPVMTVGPEVLPKIAPHELFHRVLFCTDFSPGSLHALPYAITLAREGQARLMLLHAGHVPDTGAPADLEADTADCRRRMRELLPPDAGLPHEPELLVDYGPTAEVILRAASQHLVDLIVMGVHRVRAVRFTSHLPWAIAAQVMIHAKCPVLTVRG